MLFKILKERVLLLIRVVYTPFCRNATTSELDKERKDRNLILEVMIFYGFRSLLYKRLFEKKNLQSSLSLFQQNIRGLNDKHEELICSILTHNINHQIIWLTEYYTKEQKLSSTSMENNTLAANFSYTDSKGGGSYIFVRNYKHLVLLQFLTSD